MESIESEGILFSIFIVENVCIILKLGNVSKLQYLDSHDNIKAKWELCEIKMEFP